MKGEAICGEGVLYVDAPSREGSGFKYGDDIGVGRAKNGWKAPVRGGSRVDRYQPVSPEAVDRVVRLMDLGRVVTGDVLVTGDLLVTLAEVLMAMVAAGRIVR